MPKEIIIKTDSREQNPWMFPVETKESQKSKASMIIGSEVVGLNAADYTIKGFEDIIRIERKNGFGELFGNYSPKANRERFEREMDKLIDIKHKYILIETALNKDTLGLSVPQFKYGLPANVVFKWLIELQLQYGVHVMFVGDCGQKTARNIFEEIIKIYG